MPEISKQAIVEKGAKIADDVKIGPFTYIGPHVKIGPGCIIQNNVTIAGRTTLGDRNRVFPMAVIEQKVSTDRWIQIPEPVRDIYRQWRCTPLHRARRLEMRDHGRIRRRRRHVGAAAAVGLRRVPGEVDDVLHRHRHPVQRTAPPAGLGLRIERARLRQRLVSQHRDPGLHLAVDCGDPREALLDERHRRQRAGRERGIDVADAARILDEMAAARA